MNDMLEKAFESANMIINKINDFTKKNMDENGVLVKTEETLQKLTDILENGFTLHNYIIKHEIHKNKIEIILALNALEDIISKLNSNEKNAKKLNLSSAIQLWQQALVLVASLASSVLDFKESLQ